MLSVDELQMAGDLLTEARALRNKLESSRDYAKQRKQLTLDRGWPERVECLHRCIAKVDEVERDLEGVFS